MKHHELKHVRFTEPKDIRHEMDQYGCVGFTSYGYLIDECGNLVHIKNPDYAWPKALQREGDSFYNEDESALIMI